MKTNREPYHVASAEIGIQRIQREIVKFQNAYAYDPEFLKGAQLEHFIDEMTHRAILSIQVKIASKKFESKTVRFPSDWWQAFKNRFFTPRMLACWPVVFQEVTLEAVAYHPDIAIPDRQTFVEILTTSRKAMFEAERGDC